MNEIVLFEYSGSKIRTISKDGEPWFVAKDIAEVLGYSNPQKAVRDHCKRTQPAGVNESFTLDPQTTIIPEADIYRLVMRSKLPGAEKFEAWVCDEVLPSIRKTGTFSAFQLPTSLPEALRLAADLAEQKMQLEATISAQAPKIEAFTRIAKSEGIYNLTSTAKLLNIRPSTLTNYMATNQWIYKRAGSKHWVAYQTRIEQGLLRHKTFSYGDSTGETWTREQVMVTPKGLTHLAEIFADKPQQHVTGFRGKNVSPSHIN